MLNVSGQSMPSNLPTSALDAQRMEMDMNRRHQTVIDSYFEEEHYESAIDALDQFRSPANCPSGSHLRQLLYIAIQPKSSPESTSIDTRYRELIVPLSPSKFSPSKVTRHNKRHDIPYAATTAAQRLLLAFATTNSPEALFRGLPAYQHPPKDLTPNIGGEDSLIASLANTICRAKDCWEILNNEFSKLKLDLPAPPRRKGRRHLDDVDVFDSSIGKLTPESEPVAVSEHAWPVLEFFVRVFEADEGRALARGSTQHSAVLLSQIPLPRDNNVARTDMSAVLAVIFHCWQQTRMTRRSLGTRLMVMLIHLSSSKHLDATMLISSTFAHLTPLPLDDLSAIFNDLPLSEDVSRFKISVCQRYINSSALKSASRPRPQARGSRMANRAQTQSLSSVHEDYAQATTSTGKILPIGTSDLLRLLETDAPRTTSSADQTIFLRVKLELLLACHSIYLQMPNGDESWSALLEGGQWKKPFHAAAKSGVDTGRSYANTFETIISVS